MLTGKQILETACQTCAFFSCCPFAAWTQEEREKHCGIINANPERSRKIVRELESQASSVCDDLSNLINYHFTGKTPIYQN